MVEKIKLALERAYKERQVRADSSSVRGLSRVESPVAQTELMQGVPDSSSVLLESKYSVIETNKLIHRRVVTFDDTSKYAESFRLLRTQLLHYSSSAGVSVIGVTSPSESEGKTLVAVNLAISLARSSDVSVVLVDADLSLPGVHTLLGLEVDYGLVDLLNGRVKLGDVLYQLNIPNLWVIPGRQERINLQDQNNANRVEQLVEDFSLGSQTIILIDLPPVLGRDDTLIFTSNMEGVLLVAEEGKTKNEELERSVGLLKHCNILGTVMNRSSEAKVYD